MPTPGQSISRVIAEQRGKLNVDLAAYDAERKELDRKRDELNAQWLSLRDEQNKHHEALGRYAQSLDKLQQFDSQLTNDRRALDEYELELNAREKKLVAREGESQKLKLDLASWQGDLEKNRKQLEADEEDYRVRMHRLRQLVTEYFSAQRK